MEVEGKSPSGHRPEGRSAVGIMLADPGHRPATEAERRRLADAVAQRGWSLSLRTGIATALAYLCLAEREERARESWGLPPRHDLVLLLVGGFVNCLPGFDQSPAVINGASDLFIALFGERGRHARTAAGVAGLPGNASVEVDAIFTLA